MFGNLVDTRLINVQHYSNSLCLNFPAVIHFTNQLRIQNGHSIICTGKTGNIISTNKQAVLTDLKDLHPVSWVGYNCASCISVFFINSKDVAHVHDS